MNDLFVFFLFTQFQYFYHLFGYLLWLFMDFHNI